jgi:lipoic acid synthetase
VLTPDFKGDLTALAAVVDSPIDIFNHNTETVPRLYPRARPGGKYSRALGLLDEAKRRRRSLATKTGLMLGLGEERDELTAVFNDLAEIECDILTLGQYLQPSRDHLPIERYLPPAEFDDLKRIALGIGFRHVESGPLVRSSYHAWEHVA